MSAVATMTSKGQLTIPKGVRDELKLAAGTRYDVTVVDGNIILAPRRLRGADLAGFLGKPPRGGGATVEDMDESIARYLSEDDERIRREWHEKFD